MAKDFLMPIEKHENPIPNSVLTKQPHLTHQSSEN